MDDKQAIEALYKQMYRATIAKDTATLNLVHADEFVLTHMTDKWCDYSANKQLIH